MSSRNIKLVLI